MIVNATKLDQELRAAGIPMDGCSSSGRIDFRPEATPAQREQAARILAAHDPSDTRAQKLARLGMTESLAALILVQTRGSGAPRWATDELSRLSAAIESET